MSDHSLLNNYITVHDISTTDNVSCFRLRGGSNKPDYVIIRDTRTHPLALFTNSTKPEVMHNKESEVKNKLFFNLRDKWSEAERPFIPRLWRTPESFRTAIITNTRGNTNNPEPRPGVLHFENNKPIFSIYPIWNPKGDPLLTLLLRIPVIFNWLTGKPEIVARLMTNPSATQEMPDNDSIQGRLNWIRLIEEQEGQGPLECISLRKTRMVIVTDLCPKVTTVIPFQPFVIQEKEITTIISRETFLNPHRNTSTDSLSDYDILPEFIIVQDKEEDTRGNETRPMPLEHQGYTLHAWISKNGETLNELYVGPHTTPQQLVVIRQPQNSVIQTAHAFRDGLQDGHLLLYSRQPLTQGPSRNQTFNREVKGTYTPPMINQTSPSATIPFREPMSCTATTIEELKDSDFPFIAQPKLDGNRILVHITDILHNAEGPIPFQSTSEETPDAGPVSHLSDTRRQSTALMPKVKYYSRNGNVQSAKFNEHFDKDVIAFALLLSRVMGNAKNIQLDCECYAHEVVHAEIGGWINRVTISPEFRQLKLFLLSWLDLDKLTTERKRGRDYIVGSSTFATTLFEEGVIVSDILTKLPKGAMLGLTASALAVNRESVFSLMSEVVGAGYEGLVLYPVERPYTFANAGLKKIKKFYDGECTVLSYKASETDPGAIGSVFVRTAAYFAKLGGDSSADDQPVDIPMVTFFVTAALKQEVKSGSMTSAYFASCIGKDFTVVCGSFSDTGVPIHARFKASFGPENARLDHMRV